MCENESGTTETPRDLRVPQVVTPASSLAARAIFLAAVAHGRNVAGVELTLDFGEDDGGVVSGRVVHSTKAGNVQVVGPEVNAFYDLMTLIMGLFPLAQLVDLDKTDGSARGVAA